MDRFQSLQIYVRVVENGSFSATGKELNLSQASISRHITELENEVQAKLLARTTRELKMTEVGRKFYDQAKSILEQYHSAIGEVKNLKHKPAGTLRMASAIFFGHRYITPLMAKFTKRYPEIIVEHHLSDSTTDLVKDGIDLTIRMGDMSDSTHQAKKLTAFQMVTIASKDFIKKHGMPKHPKELEKLPCVIYLGFNSPMTWNYSDKNGKIIAVDVKGPYRANIAEAAREAAISGVGIFRGPSSAFAEELRSGKLIRLFSQYDSDFFPVYAVTPASSYVPQKTRVMIDFLQDEFKRNPFLNEK